MFSRDSDGTGIGCAGSATLLSSIGLLVFALFALPQRWPLLICGAAGVGAGLLALRIGQQIAEREAEYVKATWDSFILTYPDGEAVRIGDRVAKRRFILPGEMFGRVIYVPRQAPVHPEFEHNGLRWWAVKFDDGPVAAMLFWPFRGSIRRFRLLERGDPREHAVAADFVMD